jgi:hypothetical protein
MTHPAEFQWVTGVISPGVSRAGREAYHSPHVVPSLRMREALTPLPHTPSWRAHWKMDPYFPVRYRICQSEDGNQANHITP